MLLSIITINYNNKDGLQQTLESAFHQSFTEYEYIVIDGGSTDGSKEVITNYATQLSYWVSEPDRGIYNAMNKGINQAKGKYCLFLNSGDAFADNQVLADIFEKETHDEDVLYGDFVQIGEDKTLKKTKLPAVITIDYMMNATICHQVSFIKKSLFSRFGLYEEEFKISADYAFFLKVLIAPNTTFKHLNRVISVFAADGISSKQSSIPLMLVEKNTIHSRYLPHPVKDLHQEYLRLRLVMNSRVLQKVHSLLLFSRRVRKKTGSLLHSLYKKTYTYRMYKWLHGHNKNYLQIPIIINNRNRYTYPKQLIDFLEKNNYRNIFIIDNASTYEPLLQYYSTTKHHVFRLKENVGFCALWDTPIFDNFKNSFYVYTDPDIVPLPDCPPDFLKYFLYLHKKYPNVKKVGFSLLINDLPDHYALKSKVVEWEKQFFVNCMEKNVYDAPIDTTFALYKPNEKGAAYFSRGKAIRTGTPYAARHMPWYENSGNLDPEAEYYINNIKKATSHWSEQA